MLLSAGNFAITQTQDVIDQVKRDCKENTEIKLNTVRYLSDAAEYLGKISLKKQRHHADTYKTK